MRVDLTEHEIEITVEVLTARRNTLRREGFQGISEKTIASVVKKLGDVLITEQKPTPK